MNTIQLSKAACDNLEARHVPLTPMHITAFQIGYDMGILNGPLQAVKINYGAIYRFAMRKGLHYNSLCTLVRDAVVVENTAAYKLYRHKKTGGIYEVLYVAQDEADPAVSRVVYRSLDRPSEVWSRPAVEFHERDRFELVTE